MNKNYLHKNTSISMALSKQKQSCGHDHDRFDEREKISGQEKGKQYSRPKAYGTRTDERPQIGTAHNYLPP